MNPRNPVHQVLRTVFRAMGLLQLTEALHERLWVAVTISVMMATALACSGLASAGWLHVGLAQRLANAGAAGVYLLAGVPAAVELCFNLTDAQINTHVLMTLAVFGMLAIGGLVEVGGPHVTGMSERPAFWLLRTPAPSELELALFSSPAKTCCCPACLKNVLLHLDASRPCSNHLLPAKASMHLLYLSCTVWGCCDTCLI